MTDWTQVVDAHGSVGRVPLLLDQVEREEAPETWDELWDRLCLFHATKLNELSEHNDLTGNATNVTEAARKPLVAAAKRHDMLPIAIMLTTPGSVCIERQGPQSANRTVPQEVVAQQHQDMFAARRTLKSEGFPEIVYSDSLCRLLPYLERA
ncbi:AAA family ATPase [Streptomyces sp. NPDC055025]